MKNNKKDKDPYQKISRALSAILRHKAVELGFQIDASGYVPVNDIIAYLKGKGYNNVNYDVIKEVVLTNNKKRFQLTQKKHTIYIRATQGHSMKQVQSQQLLQKIEDPNNFPQVIHGTYFKFWKLIKQQGLKRMNRNHIHFAPGMPKKQGVISGMRKSCDVYIQIDLFKAIKDGIVFYISSNNVILTEGINGILPPKYFKKVMQKNGNILLLNEQVKKIQQ